MKEQLRGREGGEAGEAGDEVRTLGREVVLNFTGCRMSFTFYLSERWRVLNSRNTCSNLLFESLNPYAMLGINKHRSNEKISAFLKQQR